jgi:N utilization substance protein A
MQSMSGGPATPIEQVSELGEQIIEKLVTAGITTVEALADMTPEELEEIPGIGEKTLEKISVAVRHYFGEYAEGEERPAILEITAESDDAGAGAPTSGGASTASIEADQVDAGTIDALETLTGGDADADLDAEAETNLSGADAEAADLLAAETDEEIAALELGLTQDDNAPELRDGSGRINDELAEERLAELTETGPLLDEEGAESLVPGREDTSAQIAAHNPNFDIARSETVLEGQEDEPRDEIKQDAKVDEGSGA